MAAAGITSAATAQVTTWAPHSQATSAAASAPPVAPRLSSVRMSAKARARWSSVVQSPTSASAAEPRTPLPTRSPRRQAITHAGQPRAMPTAVSGLMSALMP